MKKLLFLFNLLLLINYSYSQNSLLKPQECELPKTFKESIDGIVHSTKCIDFNGDKKTDFIISISDSDKNYKYLWLDSKGTIIKEEINHLPEIDYSWFINLDSDKEAEIIKAYGYEDGIDYYIVDQDLKAGKDSVLLYFTPVIEYDGSFYFGYPWFIRNLEKRKNRFKTSINHLVKRDGVITYPNNQNQLPLIIFQSNRKGDFLLQSVLDSIEWKSLKELLKQIQKN